MFQNISWTVDMKKICKWVDIIDSQFSMYFVHRNDEYPYFSYEKVKLGHIDCSRNVFAWKWQKFTFSISSVFFALFISNFHCSVLHFFYSFYWINLNLNWSSPLIFILLTRRRVNMSQTWWTWWAPDRLLWLCLSSRLHPWHLSAPSHTWKWKDTT